MAADYDFRRNRMRKEMKSSNHYILVLYLKVPLIANDCFVKYPKRPPLPKVTWQVSWYLFKKKYLTI